MCSASLSSPSEMFYNKTNPAWGTADCQKLHRNEFTSIDCQTNKKRLPSQVAAHELCSPVTWLEHETQPQCVYLIANSTKCSWSHFVWHKEGGKTGRDQRRLCCWETLKLRENSEQHQYFMRGKMLQCHYNSCKTFSSSCFTLISCKHT